MLKLIPIREVEGWDEPSTVSSLPTKLPTPLLARKARRKRVVRLPVEINSVLDMFGQRRLGSMHLPGPA
jgi:hypothetical protein